MRRVIPGAESSAPSIARFHPIEQQIDIREDFLDVVRADVAQLVLRLRQFPGLRECVVRVPELLHILKIRRPLWAVKHIALLPLAVFIRADVCTCGKAYDVCSCGKST